MAAFRRAAVAVVVVAVGIVAFASAASADIVVKERGSGRVCGVISHPFDFVVLVDAC